MEEIIYNKEKLCEFLKKMIIETLRIEDITPGDIENEAPLFREGLGLDSIDALEDHLAKYIREIEPDIPIIGLGNHASGPCLDVTYLKKPLTFELIRNIFPQLVSEKEVKVGRKALKGIVIGVCAGVLLWLLFIWILI